MSYNLRVTTDRINNIILNNNYVKNCISSKIKNENSLSYLINKPLSQSECIKLGICVEKVIEDIISEYTNYVNINKHSNSNKQRDHIFLDNINKRIYYAELKGNLYLDTEKTKSTCIKCTDIVNEIYLEYPGYTVHWCLLGYRYINNSEIPNRIKNKYLMIENNLYGINDYFKMLNIKYEFNMENYKIFLNNIVNSMIS